MFAFVRVVVEPGVGTAAVAWEAPVKRSLALCLLLPDDRSTAGAVATALIAAADGRYLVLQQQISEAAAAAAATVGVAAEKGGSGPPVGTEAIRAGRWCGKIVRVVGMCGSWASPRNPEGKKRKKNLNHSTSTTKKILQDIYLHLSVRDNTSAGPWPGPSNPRAGPQKWQPSPYIL